MCVAQNVGTRRSGTTFLHDRVDAEEMESDAKSVKDVFSLSLSLAEGFDRHTQTEFLAPKPFSSFGSNHCVT